MTRATLLALAALPLAAGCATVPPQAPAAGMKPPPRATSGAPVAAGRAALPDTVPSAEAREVLASIPEPFEPGERVPPPAGPEPPAAGAIAPADTAGRQIPVPTPTPTLGERPLPSMAPPDTVRPATAAPPPAIATRDTCWRVQFAAPAEQPKADGYRAAAESQLLLPVTVERERGLWKVRTRDCMDGAAADALRRRAAEAGFGGAFRFVERRK
ncbi:MAG: SPOR domain-containing protein [Candidatus Eisenbacteria bacterium]|nr:SPOR domain-containing protein [Candidatus Eisenbacteria bacterium]